LFVLPPLGVITFSPSHFLKPVDSANISFASLDDCPALITAETSPLIMPLKIFVSVVGVASIPEEAAAVSVLSS